MKKMFIVQSVNRILTAEKTLNVAHLAPLDNKEFSLGDEDEWLVVKAIESIFKFEPGQQIEVTVEPVFFKDILKNEQR
jgi:hypothetical protein